MTLSERFWEQKTLAELTTAEWEALCDGCGKCCLHKLLDEDAPATSEALHFTDVACQLLDTTTARCRDYQHRLSRVPDCVALTPATLHQVYYMPPSCAYRRLAKGRGLAAWHPLYHEGSQAAMIAAGISAAGRVVSETSIAELDEHCIVSWPLDDID